MGAIMLKLRELRLDSEKTQAELALFLGTSRQVYANYENGINEPSLDTLARLADFFECSTDYLLGREDDFGNVTVQGTSPNFTSEELEIVRIFRKLPNDLQRRAAAYMRNLDELISEESATKQKKNA